MPGIWNINSIYDASNNKRIFRKLSFELGENFLGRIVNLDKVTGEILLKLLDGWQFSAKLQKPLENLPEGLIRFEVEGFEDEKLNLKIIAGNSKKETSDRDSINNLLKEKNIELGKGDYTLLDKMIKHHISLTRENISNIKTIVDFMDKIKQDSSAEDTFIQKYLRSKNIDINSNKGNEFKNILKSFFSSLKDLTEDDLLTLFENNINVTEENIKSFNSVFKEHLSIYNSIKDVSKQILSINEDTQIIEDLGDVLSDGTSDNIMLDKDHNTKNINKHSNEYTKIVAENLTELSRNDINKVSDSTINNQEKIDKETLDILLKDDKSSIGSNNIDKIATTIKEQVKSNTEELKNIISKLLENGTDTNGDIYNIVSQALDRNINDIKVFNQVSNQYYYLDLPINLDNNQYECKLMIKDERKKGKKIDSTNVKIAASVNTINMGVVDAYIRLNNSNMDIDIKCDNQWIKILDKGKENILESLSKMGYNAYVKISEKQEEMNIVSCREFFDDNNLGMLDTKV